MTAMRWTPLALIAATFRTKVGICALWQVELNAAGTPTKTTFCLSNSSCVVTCLTLPSSCFTRNDPSGRRSPTLIMLVAPVSREGGFAARGIVEFHALVERHPLLDRASAGDDGHPQLRPGDRHLAGEAIEGDAIGGLAAIIGDELRHIGVPVVRAFDEHLRAIDPRQGGGGG